MAEVKGIVRESIEMYGHEGEAKVNYNTVTLTFLDVESVHLGARDGFATVSLTFKTPNDIDEVD